jgi:hypothetical protein
MNRSLTALFAALEAVIVVGVGIGIPLVPLTALWAMQYAFAVDWAVFWRASADIWLLGHGVDVHVELDPQLALGVGASTAPFSVTIAALGFALLTVLLALRAGRRVGETRYRAIGGIVALATFAMLSAAITATAAHPLVGPSVAQGLTLPTLVFATGFIIGLLRTARAEGDDTGSSIRDWVNDWPPHIRELVQSALRGGTAVVAALLTLSGALVALLIGLNYAEVIELYEGLHAGALGGFAITLGQLALLPNLVIFAASWLVGPGFAIGTGSSVGPLATQLGPVPSIPLLGALPTGELALGFVSLLAPVVIAFAVGVLLRSRLDELPFEQRPALWLGGLALGIGVVAGALLGILAAVAGGAAGPGRLVDVGPDALAVGLWAALEVALASALGLLAARQR